MPAQFYTYLWLREDGTPYYAGKGMGIRAYRKHRMGNAPPVERVIVQEFETEQDAFFAEIFLIAAYGREDQGTGCLLNLTDGGDNPPNHTGLKRTAETSKRLGAWKRTSDVCNRIAKSKAAFHAADRSLVGKRFGRLIVVSRAGLDKWHNTCWEVLCDCGIIKTVVGNSLKHGATKSCGCFNKEVLAVNRKGTNARPNPREWGPAPEAY